MKLTPISTTTEPSYPTYRVTWRQLAAAVAVSASLCLPACGDETTRLGGEPPVPIEEVRLSGDVATPQPPKPEAKPPEPPVLPVQEPVRTAGVVAPVAPPQPRLAGGPPPATPPPKGFGD